MPTREVAIDRAIYEVNDDVKTYRFLRRNPDWQQLDAGTSLQNQLALEGYTRIFRSGRRRVLKFDEAPFRRSKRPSRASITRLNWASPTLSAARAAM